MGLWGLCTPSGAGDDGRPRRPGDGALPKRPPRQGVAWTSGTALTPPTKWQRPSLPSHPRTPQPKPARTNAILICGRLASIFIFAIGNMGLPPLASTKRFPRCQTRRFQEDFSFFLSSIAIPMKYCFKCFKNYFRNYYLSENNKKSV